MDDLLSFDLARTVGNILDAENVYDFELKLNTKASNETQWAIHFSTPNPKLYNTGDAHINTYEGEIYILKQDFVITRIDIRGTSNKRSIHGKAIAVTEKTNHFYTDYQYDVSIRYAPTNKRYHLSAVSMTANYKDEQGKMTHTNTSLSIDSIDEQFVPTKGRDYYISGM